MSWKDLRFVMLWECDAEGCESFVARSNQYMYTASLDDRLVISFVRRHFREDHPLADPPPDEELTL